MFKLSVVTRGSAESMYDGMKFDERANALRVFDAIRQAAQRGIAERGWTAYESAHLLTDDAAETSHKWESADAQFRYIVDGECWPLPAPTALVVSRIGCGCRPATDEEYSRTGEYIYPCGYHGEKYGTAYELESQS